MKGISAYKENAITTQSKGRLVVLLYEGAIKFLKQAVKELEAQDNVKKGEYINKAVAIIDELNACLDMEAGGEIAQNLRSLYHFMRRHLWEANMQRDPQRIREVIGILEDLNKGWSAITS
jgi:flagellar protein FliS